MSELKAANAQVHCANEAPTHSAEVRASHRSVWRLDRSTVSRVVSGAMTVLAMMALLGYAVFQAPDSARRNLDMCIADHIDTQHHSDLTWPRDLRTQPEFIETLSLCESPHP